jgi:hypothetical protein
MMQPAAALLFPQRFKSPRASAFDVRYAPSSGAKADIAEGPTTDIATRSSPTRFARKKATQSGGRSISGSMMADHAAINGFDFRQ